jgi:peroxiredoxin
MQGFVEAQDDFAECNAQVIGVSVDPWPAANAFAESLGANFPLLGDWPLNNVSRAYDVYNDERYIANRVTFVIDENRVIRAVIDEPRDMERHSQEALAAVRALAGT